MNFDAEEIPEHALINNQEDTFYMKKNILFSFLLLLFIPCFAQKKGTIDRETKIFTLQAALDDNYTIFGFALPDTKSEVLILFSSHMSEVKSKGEKCKLGSYSETIGLPDGDRIVYDSEKDGFARLNYISPGKAAVPFYVKRGIIKFD